MGAAGRQVVTEVSLDSLRFNRNEVNFSPPPDCSETSSPLLSCWRYKYLKRTIDILCSLSLIVLLAIPGLVIAILILLTSKGPVFYREQRIGRGGRLFRIWKFRSMHRHAAHFVRVHGKHDGSEGLEWRMHKGVCDPRITVIGRFLRRWSLDELPQFFNVLRGEMSLIGPRPIVKAECSLYGDLIEFYLAAKPGISGLWQVSGRSNLGYVERALLDAQYVQKWNPGTDIKICLLTFSAVLGRVGAV